MPLTLPQKDAISGKASEMTGRQHQRCQVRSRRVRDQPTKTQAPDRKGARMKTGTSVGSRPTGGQAQPIQMQGFFNDEALRQDAEDLAELFGFLLIGPERGFMRRALRSVPPATRS